MMRSAVSIFVGLILLVYTGASAQTKVGYVDVDRVTRKAKAVNQAMDHVQSGIEELQKQIDEKRQQVKELEADVQRSEGVVAPGEIEKKRKEITRLKNELDDLAYRAERKARELDATVFEPLMKRILFAIQDVAKENKYDIILRGEAVLYGTSAVDITDEVIRKLNEDTSSTSVIIEGKNKAAEQTRPQGQTSESQPDNREETQKTSSQSSPTGSVEPSQPTPPSEGSARKAQLPASTKKPKRPVDRQPD
jgi:outer membrane protein